MSFYGVEKVVKNDDVSTTLKPLIDIDKLRAQWPAFRIFMADHCRDMDFAGACANIINDQSAAFSEFAILACIAIVLPLSSVNCERGFSLMNAIKTKFRTRLNDDTLSVLMRIARDGPEELTKEMHERVLVFFKAEAERRLFDETFKFEDFVTHTCPHCKESFKV